MGHFEIPLHNKTGKFSSRLYSRSRQNTYFFSPLHTTPVHCLLTAPAMSRFTSSADLPLPAFRAASASAQGANSMGSPGIQLSGKQQAMIKCLVCAFCIVRYHFTPPNNNSAKKTLCLLPRCKKGSFRE